MDLRISRPRRSTFKGAIQVFSSELLLLPTGYVIIAVLTRWLGAELYGVYVLGLLIIAWLESILSSVLNQSSIVLTVEQDDIQENSIQILQTYLVAGATLAGIAFLSASAISQSFQEPRLELVLQILALDIPLTAISQGYQAIWIGKGQYSLRARISALRWLSRLIFVVVFVAGGFSLFGAIVANVAATFVEAVYAITRKPINPFKSWATGKTRRPAVILPIAAFVLSYRLFVNLDLPSLRLLGITFRDLGLYGAARNLAVVPGIISLSAVPPLLSTVRKNLAGNRISTAAQLVTDALRASFFLIPFAAMVIGSSQAIVELLLGKQFLGAAIFLNLLVPAAVFQAIFSIASASLIATKNYSQLVYLGLTMMPLSIVIFWIGVPIWGAVAAAWTMALLSLVAAIIVLKLSYQIWEQDYPLITLAKSGLITVLAFTASYVWQMSGYLVLVEMALLSSIVFLGILVSGEYSAEELGKLRKFLSELFNRHPFSSLN